MGKWKCSLRWKINNKTRKRRTLEIWTCSVQVQFSEPNYKDVSIRRVKAGNDPLLTLSTNMNNLKWGK